jgi:TonB-dependent receptor
VEYDFRNGDVNTVKLFATGGTTTARTRGAQITNIEDFQFPYQTLGKLEGADITMANTAKFDVDYRSDLFGGTKIEFGGLYTERTKKSRETNWIATYSTGTIPTWATFATSNPGYLGDQNLNYTFRYTNQGLLTGFVQNLVDSGVAVKQDTRGNYYKVTEDLAAAYLMATTTFDWGNVVYGVRAEHIKNTGEAFVNFPASGANPAGLRLVNTSSSDTLFYPSVHLNFNLRDDVKLRISGTTSASRPDYDDLRPNFTINDAAQSISGGNPEAKPEKQMGLDTYLEWYMGGSNFLSAGVFYKDVRDVLVQRSSVFGLDTLNTATLDRSGYAFTGVGNGGDGHLQGLELFYTANAQAFVDGAGMPDWLGGFGVNASATFTSSKVKLPSVGGVPERTISLLGTSDAVYNLQATYEKYGLSVRLAYQYRTPWGESVGAYRVAGGGVYPVDNGDIFWDSDEEIDLSVRYQVNKNWELFFDGVNLGDMGARRYGDQKRYPIEFEKFGPRYIGGFRFNF